MSRWNCVARTQWTMRISTDKDKHISGEVALACEASESHHCKDSDTYSLKTGLQLMTSYPYNWKVLKH